MKEVTYHLEIFDGPLDLLLHLISQNKVNIWDIPISNILEQYLAYIEKMREFDLDVAADFIAMAAQLMYIKSKMLLPVYEDEKEDPRAALVEALLDYQRFKEAGTVLSTMAEVGKDLYVKQPEILEKDKTAIVYDYNADVLEKAIRNIFERNRRKMPPPISSFSGIVGKESVPVSQKIEQLLKMFITHDTINFENIVLQCQSRSEVVAVFLAVLELSKERRVIIEDGDEGYTLWLVGD